MICIGKHIKEGMSLSCSGNGELFSIAVRLGFFNRGLKLNAV